MRLPLPIHLFGYQASNNCLTARCVESESSESHVLRWSRSRFLRYEGVGVEIFFATPTLILIILYVIV